CDTALVCGFAEQKPRIDADLIHDVVRDKMIGGILPSWEQDSRDGDVIINVLDGKKQRKQ
ncbi:MAG: hypothetical protein ACE5EH_11425, partial [Gammaproteobacteria bacterium]